MLNDKTLKLKTPLLAFSAALNADPPWTHGTDNFARTTKRWSAAAEIVSVGGRSGYKRKQFKENQFTEFTPAKAEAGESGGVKGRALPAATIRSFRSRNSQLGTFVFRGRRGEGKNIDSNYA